MRFDLHIELGNAAMQSGEHIAGALREVAEKAEAGHDEGLIHDVNGNTVGQWEMKHDGSL